MEWRSRRDRRIEALPFPAGIRIVDAAVQALRVVAHRIGHAQRYELALRKHQQSLRQIAGRNRRILAGAKRVEAINKVVIRRVGAAVLHRSFVVRTREWIERPALRAVLPRRGGRAIERALALAAVEAREMSAR